MEKPLEWLVDFVPAEVRTSKMAIILRSLLASLAAFCPIAIAASSSSQSNSANDGTKTGGTRPYGTLPPNADVGAPILPNILDPQAKNPQSMCPGYKASNVKRNAYGLTANLALAGKACNVYGDDVDSLQLSVQYQSADRVKVEITPTYIGSKNESWFVPPASIMGAAILDSDAAHTVPLNDLEFTYGNQPSFWMKVLRKSNSDVLFDTSNTKLVFENQFVEFVTALPEDYNLYGLGESIHALRLGNNFTKTMWNTDVGS